MIIHKGYENLHLVTPVVTLGIFDGVHRGHQTLLNRLVSSALKAKGESVVITFFPHPRMVLDQGNTSLSFLSTMEEKIALLDNAKIDHLIIIEFDKKFSRLSACDFVKEILIGKIRTKHLIIGFNHHFGRRGEGDYKTLRKCTDSHDFQIEQVQGYHTEERVISSSSIREYLLNGRLDDANSSLGYQYSLKGTVKKGRQIGRSIGFPTANVSPDDPNKLIPANGVYAVEVKLEKETYPGMMSIGSNPTVNSDTGLRNIEVNILNFSGNIYDRSISVVFRKRLRDEIKFENLAALAEQLEIDKQQVLKLCTL